MIRLGTRQIHRWTRLTQTLFGGRRVLFTSLSVGAFVVALRLAGLLQPWELATLDQLFRARPLESADNRIVVVGIDEMDLRRVGKHPIPDVYMAKLLSTIQAAKPRAIGLDLYRDLPVEPGHRNLLAVYEQIPNLVGIEHMADKDSPKVPAPPILGARRQVGFNNVVHDQDDKVRRGLLYWKPVGSSKARQSFALVLALIYLKSEGILPKPAVDDPENLQLGSAVFRRFSAYDGSYVNADSGGYQVLLNPRGPANTFRRVYLADVLEGRVPPSVFRDRVVLIGYTAVSLNDFVYTSYSSQLTGAPIPVPGIELHANLVSHILGAALDGRALIQTWAEPFDWLWVWVWAWIGANICWRARSLRTATPALVVAGVGLVGSCYVALIVGWWIPIVPPMLAGLGSAVAIIAHQARSQEELRRSKEFLNRIINAIPDPIFVKDRSHRWIVLNEAYARFLGYPLQELLEQSDYDVFVKDEADKFREQDDWVFNTQEECQSEEVFTDRMGKTHQIETKRSLHKDAAGNLFLVGIIRDITERKRMEDELKLTAAELVRSNAELIRSADQLSHLANHDTLTGIPNRKLFYERLAQSLDWATENDQLVAVLFLDLDGFKAINDSLGHDMGDLLLRAVAQRLAGCLRGSDTVARLGGDEFTIILPAIPSIQDTRRVAEKLLATLSGPFLIEAQTISVTSSVGIGIYPTHARELEALVKQADNAMYRAKQTGKNCFRFAEPNVQSGKFMSD